MQHWVGAEKSRLRSQCKVPTLKSSAFFSNVALSGGGAGPRPPRKT